MRAVLTAPTAQVVPSFARRASTRLAFAKHSLFCEVLPLASPVRDHYGKLLGPVY
jgi:hypothetical protein